MAEPERTPQTPRDQRPERRAFGLAAERLATSALRVPHVLVFRGDAEIATEHERQRRITASLPEAVVPDELVLVLVRAYLAAIGCVEVGDAGVDPGDQDGAPRSVDAVLDPPKRVT